MNILYTGNKLQSQTQTATTIDTLGPQLESLGYHVKYASSQHNKVLRFGHMIWSVIANFKWADKILIDTYSTQNFWYAIAVAHTCKLFNIAYIPILHGGNLPARLQSHPSVIDRFLNGATHVVSPSVYLQQAFAKANFSHITVIPNSIQGNHYPFKKRERCSPRLLWVRSLASIYNPQMAMSVVEILSKKYPEASLTIVGPDKENLMTELENQAKNKQLKVNFTGLLSKQEWIALSNDHDIFINTSHVDNLPVSLIEAMALGMPVVSTRAGGIPALIEHNKNGLLVDDGDYAMMAATIEQLITSPDMSSRLSQEARSTAQTYFWKQVKEQWITILS